MQTLKSAQKQSDAWNCGPITLFQAVLLAAVVDNDAPEFIKFRKDGLPRFKAAFGIDVLTREEIIQGKE